MIQGSLQLLQNYLNQPAYCCEICFAKILVLPEKLEQRKTSKKGADALLATQGKILAVLSLT